MLQRFTLGMGQRACLWPATIGVGMGMGAVCGVLHLFVFCVAAGALSDMAQLDDGSPSSELARAVGSWIGAVWVGGMAGAFAGAFGGFVTSLIATMLPSRVGWGAAVALGATAPWLVLEDITHGDRAFFWPN